MGWVSYLVSSTNTNLGTLLEQAISGYVTQSVTTGTDTPITIPDGASGVARNMFIELTGSGGASTNLIVPSNKKLYFIYNNTTTTPGQVTVKVSGQTGVSVPYGAKTILVSNGTDIIDATNYVSSLTLGAALPVTSGGTGSTTSTGSGAVVLATSPTLVTPALGTPTALVGTNITGTAAGLSIGGNAATATSATSATSATNATNATQITNAGGWNVTPSGTKLNFVYNGTTVFSIDSSGNIIAKANVTAYGTP